MVNGRDEIIGISYGKYSVRHKQVVSRHQETIDNHAKKQGILILKRYLDISSPHYAESRPQLNMMLRDVQSMKPPVDHLLIYSSCRILRDTESNVRTILEILNYVNTVVLVTEQVTYTADDFKWLATSLIRPGLGAGF
ncbi:recombinase family protein [Sporosarcina sp. FSL W7-1349]|uniref:recombinase family protein n=1 Tax=Sporosarcina sp. FSL W7-1349 TaxID=2921561 RepID=UPI0030F8655E